MSNLFQITKKQKETVLTILNQFFPHSEFFVYGSRATCKSLKPFSDLDIAIRNTVKIDLDQIAQAAEAFSSSDLPFKVDLIDLKSISDEFRSHIENDLVQLQNS